MIACHASPASTQTHDAEPSTAASSAASSVAESANAPESVTPSAPSKPRRPNPGLFGELPDSQESYLVAERHTGFSADDAYLGYEVSRCDPCPTEFHFESPTKPALDFGYYYDPAHQDDAVEKRQNADVERQLKVLNVSKGYAHVLRGPFPFPDLVFATLTDRNDVRGTVSVLFGARVSGYAPVFPMRVELGPGPMFGTPMVPSEQARIAKLPPDERKKELHDWASQWLLGDPVLAYANVTHDGSEIGVVAMVSGVMWYETAGTARMSTKAFVGQVYNDTGMRFHRAAKFTQAAKLFEHAEGASPETSLFSYNLACAYAKAKDARAKDALGRAIQKGGDEIKTRARGDADFADVKTESWFKDLAGS
jgi:hypothetical protein